MEAGEPCSRWWRRICAQVRIAGGMPGFICQNVKVGRRGLIRANFTPSLVGRMALCKDYGGQFHIVYIFHVWGEFSPGRNKYPKCSVVYSLCYRCYRCGHLE